jgi:hypothetical protein
MWFWHHMSVKRKNLGYFMIFPLRMDRGIYQIIFWKQCICRECVLGCRSFSYRRTYADFWNCLRTIRKIHHLSYERGTFQPDVQSVEVKILVGFNEDSSIDCGTWVVEGFLGLDVDSQFGILWFWISHSNYIIEYQ